MWWSSINQSIRCVWIFEWRLNERQFVYSNCSLIWCLRIDLVHFYSPFGCVLCWRHSRSATFRRQHRWQWPRHRGSAPGTTHDTNDRSIWPPASTTDISRRESDSASSHASIPALTSALTTPDCTPAIRCRHTALADRWVCSRSECNDPRCHRRWPTGRGDVATRQLPSQQPYARNMFARGSVSADSTRRVCCRCRRWPGTDCPETIWDRTPLAGGRWADALTPVPVYVYHVAWWDDRVNHLTGCHRSRLAHPLVPNDLAVC